MAPAHLPQFCTLHCLGDSAMPRTPRYPFYAFSSHDLWAVSEQNCMLCCGEKEPEEHWPKQPGLPAFKDSFSGPDLQLVITDLCLHLTPGQMSSNWSCDSSFPGFHTGLGTLSSHLVWGLGRHHQTYIFPRFHMQNGPVEAWPPKSLIFHRLWGVPEGSLFPPSKRFYTEKGPQSRWFAHWYVGLKNVMLRWKLKLFSLIFIYFFKGNLADYNALDLLLLPFHLGGKECDFIFPPTDFWLKQDLVTCWSCWLFKWKTYSF